MIFQEQEKSTIFSPPFPLVVRVTSSSKPIDCTVQVETTPSRAAPSTYMSASSKCSWIGALHTHKTPHRPSQVACLLDICAIISVQYLQVFYGTAFDGCHPRNTTYCCSFVNRTCKVATGRCNSFLLRKYNNYNYVHFQYVCSLLGIKIIR